MAGHGWRIGGSDDRCGDRGDDRAPRAAVATVEAAIERFGDALAPSDAHAVTAGILDRLRQHHFLPAAGRAAAR